MELIDAGTQQWMDLQWAALRLLPASTAVYIPRLWTSFRSAITSLYTLCAMLLSSQHN